MLVKSWRHVLKYTQRHVAGCHLICLVWLLWVGENKKLPVKVEKGQWAWCFVGKVFPKHGSNFQEQPDAWRKKQKHVELRFLELWNVMNMSSLVRDHVFIQSFDCWRFCGHIIISKKEVQTRHQNISQQALLFPIHSTSPCVQRWGDQLDLFRSLEARGFQSCRTCGTRGVEHVPGSGMDANDQGWVECEYTW